MAQCSTEFNRLYMSQYSLNIISNIACPLEVNGKIFYEENEGRERMSETTMRIMHVHRWNDFILYGCVPMYHTQNDVDGRGQHNVCGPLP